MGSEMCIRDRLRDNQNEQAVTQNEINELTRRLTDLRDILDDLNTNINDAISDLERREIEVTRLENLLMEARKQVRDARQNLDDLQDLRNNGPQRVAELESQINQKKTQVLGPLANNETDIEETIANIEGQVRDIGNTIDGTENNIANVNAQITSTSTTVTTTTATINARQGEIQQALRDLRILENELPSFNSKLQEAYHLGNDINTRVADARQNLNGLIARLENESNELIQFTRQLEVARAEKEGADISMEALLQEKSLSLIHI